MKSKRFLVSYDVHGSFNRLCYDILNLKEYEHRYPAVNRKIQDTIHDFVTQGFQNNASSVSLSLPPTNGQNRRYQIRRDSLNSMENELIVVSTNKKKTGTYVVLTREQEIQLVASAFIHSLKQHGHCSDAKSVYVRMSKYDISKKRIYAIRQHIIQSVSAHPVNKSTSEVINHVNVEKTTPSNLPRPQHQSQTIPRELQQLGVLSEELPPKRNGRI